jgi:hypothetical protein
LGAGETSPFWRAQAPRIEAHLAAARDEDGVQERFEEASTGFRKLGVPFWLAVALTEHGEWLASRERTDEGVPLLAEAREIFERLQARPWIDRASRSLPAAASTAGG